MYQNHIIALVIPAHNEERLIGRTLSHIPKQIDRVYVVDDGSTDGQNGVVAQNQKSDTRIVLITHAQKKGPGGAIISGYLRAMQDGCDIAVVVGADFQMDLASLESFLRPIVEQRADYVKGNRFAPEELGATWRCMPVSRFVGNWMLTVLTRLASGDFSVTDVVDGYTAISKRAMEKVNWSNAWRGYGYPMDFIIRLSAQGFIIVDIPRRAIYLKGERQSQIKSVRYMARVLPMLIRSFFGRLAQRYVYPEFHPLVLFYLASLCLVPSGITLGLYHLIRGLLTHGNPVTIVQAALVALLVIPGTGFFLFAMIFDRQESCTWISQKAAENSKDIVKSRNLRATASSTR